MPGPNNQAAGGWLGTDQIGVITGFIVRDPQSATLTTTIEGGWINILLGTGLVSQFRIVDTSKAFTASKDTYVYVSSAGALGYLEVANGAAKPTKATLEATGGVGAQFIAKVVTDGTRVTDGGVSDLRLNAGIDMESDLAYLSFNATEVGAWYMIAPSRIRVWKLQTTAVDTLANTDVGTITAAAGVNDKYTNMTNGQTSLALSSATGTRASALPSAYYIIDAGQSLRLTSAKATAGGSSITQILYSKF